MTNTDDTLDCFLLLCKSPPKVLALLSYSLYSHRPGKYPHIVFECDNEHKVSRACRCNDIRFAAALFSSSPPTSFHRRLANLVNVTRLFAQIVNEYLLRCQFLLLVAFLEHRRGFYSALGTGCEFGQPGHVGQADRTEPIWLDSGPI